MKLLPIALAVSLLATGQLQAEVVTDGSMGIATKLAGDHYKIPETLGTGQGRNLFHSFSRFDLTTGQSATFTLEERPASIQYQNVISRVTGMQPSTIRGTITVPTKGVNLYLVNPSGIIFAPGAELDVSGSFYATTADYLQIGPVRFDARTATVPDNFRLAIVPPSAFGFLGANPAPIFVTDATLEATGAITFVGGDISIRRNTGGSDKTLFAPGGVNLVSVASAGEAAFSGATIETSSFSKRGTATVWRNPQLRPKPGSSDGSADISTTTGRIFISAGSFIVDGAYVASDASGTLTSGGVQIDALDVDISKGGVIGSSSARGKAGDIGITATGSVTVDGGGSAIEIRNGEGTPDAGNLIISAEAVSIRNRASVVNAGSRTGKGGDINITADRSVMVGGNSIIPGQPVLPSTIETTNSGNITVTAPEVTVAGLGRIDLNTSGSGKGGTLHIAGERVTVGSGSMIKAKQGSIMIATGTLRAESGGKITAVDSVTDSHDVTGISIKARNVVVEGDQTRIGTEANAKQAGDIAIDAVNTVTIDGGAAIYVGNWKGDRKARITISAADLEVTDGGRVNSVSKENQADIKIALRGDLTVSGAGSLIRSNTLGPKDAGNITISAAKVLVEGGGAIDTWVGDPETSDVPEGSGGSIDLEAARSVVIRGYSIDQMGLHPSRIDVSTKGKGNGGTLTVRTPFLQLSGRAEISSNTSDEGNAGSVTIETGRLDIDNAAISTSSTSSGDGGRILVITEEAKLQNSARIDSSTRGSGDAGSIDLHAEVLQLGAGGEIRSSAEEKSAGTGGRVIVAATERIAIYGVGSGIATDSAGTGAAGSILVTAPSLAITDGGSISAKSSGKGDAGSISLGIGDRFFMDAGHLTTAAEHATGGEIAIDPVLAYLRNGSIISTSVHGGMDNGGDITFAAGSVVLDHSTIAANAWGGNGGSVRITADSFFSNPAAEMLVSASSQRGLPGTVDISAPLVDVSGNLVLLPDATMGDDDLAPRSCAINEASSSFIVSPSRLERRPEQNLLSL